MDAINHEQLQKLAKLMPPAALADLVQRYLEDSRQRMVALADATAAKDAEAAEMAAHSIKGSSGMLGFCGVAEAAALAESAAEQADFTALETSFPAIARAIEELPRLITSVVTLPPE